MCVIVLYAAQWISDGAIPIIGVALLAAGAAWLVAVIVGFLFGIPRLSDNTPGPLQQYRPSTSLEQVADWLTKMIVGVGLTQLNKVHQRFCIHDNLIVPGAGEAFGGPFAGGVDAHFRSVIRQARIVVKRIDRVERELYVALRIDVVESFQCDDSRALMPKPAPAGLRAAQRLS